jgi:hypothetical protein
MKSEIEVHDPPQLFSLFLRVRIWDSLTRVFGV